MAGSSQASPDDDPGPELEPGGGVGSASAAAAGPAESASEPTSGSDTAGTSTPSEAAAAAALRKEKGRVRFNSNAAATKPPTSPPVIPTTPKLAPTQPARPSILRGGSGSSIPTVATFAKEEPHLSDDNERQEAKSAAAAAQERARQMAANVHSGSPSRDNRHSIESATTTTASEYDLGGGEGAGGYIALQDLHSRQPLNGKSNEAETKAQEHHAALNDEAYKIVRAHTWRLAETSDGGAGPSNAQEAETHKATEHLLQEINDGQYDGVYSVPAPTEYRGSVLSQLLKLYKPAESGSQYQSGQNNRSSVTSFSFGGALPGAGTPGSNSGTATPTTPGKRKWYDANRSQETLVNLIEASARLANPNTQKTDESPKDGKAAAKKTRAKHKRTASNSIAAYLARQEEEAKITVHIAETLSRQEYIIMLCKALMLFGAPTHRLEEYLSTTAKVLEIDGHFLYLPGCMIISFDDRSTHTTEVRIVRVAQGIDLGKLRDTHHVYKEVIHDVVSVDDGIQQLDTLIKAKDKFHAWIRVLVFGLTSATAAPFSFGARLIDLPLCFFFGCLVGFLQLIVAANSKLYSNVLEVTATVLVSFLARAFGSIKGGELFCFSAMAQGGIVMLLPGYAVLCSALELQSRAIVPGSIRIVYAIIYSLFLGFGITIGAVLYGMFDSNAVSTTSCTNSIPAYYSFIFVPLFVLCISILYQAKWRQMPVMLVVAFAGYIVNYFSSLRFSAAPQVANALGALTVGVLANLYSRLRHGVAAATLIPAIFTQVPGGLASTGGLLSGLTAANAITNSTHAVNGTSSVHYSGGESVNTVVFNVAASMIQIAIGIAVGLFISALIIYPLGKRRSGLFSF
ncbi:hypothetical protein CORC01_12115 [Colletotrichum orchidophilum]|uniref:Threonine/serine exporter-like N-terminal domain-containing protein n=1 Tax=Colletotrichum orchidophilum TaxID=1209926 RepID=A0A1G4ATX4_9PEZI|nr:uncharacterized protein CORC01_12115 [Colletotrichum orchidophilum]OHE92604.1 hypothetical protein CORC01_12115 [Colletotrichum orchidophilum]